MSRILINGRIKTRSDTSGSFGDKTIYEFECLEDNGRRVSTKDIWLLNDRIPLSLGLFMYNNMIGVLPTERFYFLFPWKICFRPITNTLDFSSLNGLFELAHGDTKNTLPISTNPFSPPSGKKWEINWVGPHGSYAFGPTQGYDFLKGRTFGTSYIDTTGDNATGRHILYDISATEEITQSYSTECHQGGKYTNRLKYISGTISDRTQIKDYYMYKLNEGVDFEEHRITMIHAVEMCNHIGCVITRNRQFKSPKLSDLLAAVAKWGLPPKLVFSSCRPSPLKPIPTWNETNNRGFKSFYVLGEISNVNFNSGTPIGVEKEY